MPTYDYRCDSCSNEWDAQVLIAEREQQVCTCGAPAKLVIKPVMIMKASYPDGHRRFSDLKEAAKLQKEAANSKDQKKKEIAQEIRKMGIQVAKDGI